MLYIISIQSFVTFTIYIKLSFAFIVVPNEPLFCFQLQMYSPSLTISHILLLLYLVQLEYD